MATFTDGTQLIIQVVDVVDANGQPATLTTPPTWTTSNTSILNLPSDIGGMSVTATAAATGNVTVTATSGTISASVAIDVIAGGAVSFQLQVSVAPATPAPAPTAG